jgi:MinD superfamily P-loop ATPase
MIEIAVISGKGGSGKTTLASSLAFLFNEEKNKIVVADADVDTPSLHFLLQLKEVISDLNVNFSRKASIDEALCSKCMKCVYACQFSAITVANNFPKIDKYLCEGCGACKIVCPSNAIKIEETTTGKLTVGVSKYGFPFVTAQLELGEHNSGALVDAVRSKAREIATKSGADLILIDGAPGIGCPVTSTLVGVNYAIIVAEPTPASEDGAKRVLEVAKHFGIKSGFVVNKASTSNYREHIVGTLKEQGSEYLGDIPLDFSVVKALSEGKPVVEYDSTASKAIRKVFFRVKEVLKL